MNFTHLRPRGLVVGKLRPPRAEPVAQLPQPRREPARREGGRVQGRTTAAVESRDGHAATRRRLLRGVHVGGQTLRGSVRAPRLRVVVLQRLYGAPDGGQPHQQLRGLLQLGRVAQVLDFLQPLGELQAQELAAERRGGFRAPHRAAHFAVQRRVGRVLRGRG